MVRSEKHYLPSIILGVLLLVGNPLLASTEAQPEELSSPVDQVIDLMSDGKVEQALSALDALLKSQPQDRRLHLLRGEILLELKRPEEVPAELARIPKADQGAEYWGLSVLSNEQLVKKAPPSSKAERTKSLHKSVSMLLGFHSQFTVFRATLLRVLREHPNPPLAQQFCTIHRGQSNEPCPLR